MCKRKRTELEQKILNEMQAQINYYYDYHKISYKTHSNNPEETVANFFAFKTKHIPVVKWKVEYSKELLKKISDGSISKEHIDILKKYEEAFQSGVDMNGFLSNRTTSPDKTDFLSCTWHIYHLHMSGKFAVQSKNNRSDTLLLCVIEDGIVYFIDVIPHGSKPEAFFDLKFLEIIARNHWMKVIGFQEMNGIDFKYVLPDVTTGEDIFELYRNGINFPIKLDGKVYYPIEPITAARTPKSVTDQMIVINRNLTKLNRINAKYRGFKFAKSSRGYLMGVVEFEDADGKIKKYNIFEPLSDIL